MKNKLKNMPQLTLMALLKRRKLSLKQFTVEFAINSADELLNKCVQMGVLPPSIQELNKLFSFTNVVNDPQNGVIVIESFGQQSQNIDNVTQKSILKQKKQKTVRNIDD